MTDRTVTANLVLTTTGYIPAAKAASETTSGLTAAQKEVAASSKQVAASLDGTAASSVETSRQMRLLTTAQREATASAREAAAAATEASKTLVSAEREVAAASKDAAAAEALSAKATTDEERQAAVAAGDAAVARRASADAAVEAAQRQVAASSEVAASMKAQASAATAAVTGQRDAIAVAREGAIEETTAAKATEDAAAKRSAAYTDTGKKMLVAGAVLVGAFVEAEKATTDFDKSLSGVQAVSNATATEMDGLRAAALQAGKDTAFTATQAADAEGELVKAGVSVADTLNGGLKGALSLAAAGQLDLADSATISANAMNTFGLKGSDVGHIADVLAAGANKSAADVKELAYGMQQGGLVAAQMGLSFEDTTAVLSAFADRGLKGADAGTSLKTMLEKLSSPTTQAADQMKALGLNAWDTSGKFVGLQNFAGQLQDKLGGLTDQQRNAALATIFGSDAVRGASVLYDLGAKGVKGYSDAVNDQGAAARVAATQMDNLSGDLKQLKGSVDVALIGSGGAANTVLRDMAQVANDVVKAFASLPKPVQEAAVGFAGGAGSLLLMVGGLTSVAGKIGTARTAMAEMSEAATGLKAVLGSVGTFLTGPYGIALAGAAAVVAIFASKHNDAKVAVTDFSEAIKADGNSLADSTTKAVAADLATKGLVDSFGKLGISAGTVTSAALGNKAAMDQLTNATAAAVKTTDTSNMKGIQQAAVLEGNLGSVKAMTGGLHDQLAQQQQATAGAQDATDAAGKNAAATAAAADAAKTLAANTYAAAGASSQSALAATALADTTAGATTAVDLHSTATKNSATSTKDATAIAAAQKAEIKAGTTAANDSTKAAVDRGKAVYDGTKADTAATTAAKAQAAAAAASTASAKAGTTATSAQTAAARANSTEVNANATATKAAATATDAATKVSDAHTKTLAAQAKATADTSKASASEAAAQKAAADAARLAGQDHEFGTAALQAMAKQLDATNTSTGKFTDAVDGEVGAMKDAKAQSGLLKDAMDALNGVHIAAGKAAIDVQTKMHDLGKAFQDNGTTLDITTEKGRANMSQIYDTAAAVSAHAQAVVDETGSLDKGNQALDASRVQFDKVLAAAGLSKDQIQAFNDTILKTPKMVTIPISADTSDAWAKINAIREAAGQPIVFKGTSIKAMAAGGRVVGPGTPTSDSVPIMASNDEFILNAAASRAIGYDSLTKWNNAHGGAQASIVRPQLVGPVGGTTPHPAAAAASSPLHIEHYHEAAGGGASQTAEELAWLAKGRG